MTKEGYFMKKGIIIVHTGDGKGKTTAALGLAMRAWGDGLRILILQFIKGGWKYGELEAIRRLGERIEIRQCGHGFTQREKRDHEEDVRAAGEAMEQARAEVKKQCWDMLILDEINYAVQFGLLEEREVLQLLEEKPAELHVVLTGRAATEPVLAMADLVTEMKLIKHPFQKGIKAQKGIEF
jgi:cob(I)alamin adenosyltransferase